MMDHWISSISLEKAKSLAFWPTVLQRRRPIIVTAITS
jgi:hypothetical protein